MDEVIIIIGLILLNGIFAMSEVALISARKSRLSTDAKKETNQRVWRWNWRVNPTAFFLPFR